MRILDELLIRVSQLPRPLTGRVRIERGLACRLDDGVVLRADRFRPAHGPAGPTVLLRTPYGRSGFDFVGRAFAQRGFQVVVQAVRGTDGSGGVFEPFRQEAADAEPALDWIRQQPWFDGRLLLYGPSYLGYVQWPLASLNAPEIVAMAAQFSGPGIARVLYPGGSLALDIFLRWSVGTGRGSLNPLRALSIERRLSRAVNHLPLLDADLIASGEPAPFWRTLLNHAPPDDAHWQDQAAWSGVAQISAPVHLLGGWYDFFLPDTVRVFEELRRAGHQPHLLIGPWAHGGLSAMHHDAREALDWFTTHLSGATRGLRQHSVRVFVTGAESWQDFPDWPPPGFESRPWYLQGDGVLAPTAPVHGPPDGYRYDPSDPTPAVGGIGQVRNFGPVNQRRLEARADVLTYTSAPLPTDLMIAGPVVAEVYVASSSASFDVFACVCDVTPGGASVNLTSGEIRVQAES